MPTKSETLSMKTIINELDFLVKKVLVYSNAWRKERLLLLANKFIENIPDLSNAKEHYESFLRKKNRKSVKQSEIITNQLKTFHNSNIIDIKSDFIEHTKTSHKLSKTIKKGRKVHFFI